MTDPRLAHAVEEAFGVPAPKRFASAYAPINSDARLTYVWAAALLQLGALLLSSLGAAIVAAAIVLGSGASLTTPQGAQLILIIALVVQFPLWAGMIGFWVVSFERRSLASAGFCGPRPLQRYAIGVAGGVGIAIALGMFSPLVAPEPEIAVEAFDIARLAGPEWILTLSLVAVVFLFQGACEEFAFRGWQLSSAAGRRGINVGIVVSSTVFGALHFHLLASGVLSGFLGMAALGFVGLFFAIWAVTERSIVGVCGVHGGFNASLVVLGTIGAAAMDPNIGPIEALMRTVQEATSIEGAEGVAGAMLQLAFFGALSALGWVLTRKARARP